MEKVRYGIIGLGGIFALRHQPELAKIPQVQIEMVCDVNDELVRKTARSIGCRATTDYREVIHNDSIDAVMVLTPPEFHEEMSVAAARAGKHVFCEKPLAPDLPGCRNIIDAAEKKNVLLCVGENHVFDPFIHWIDRLLDEGILGEIRRLRLVQGWWGPSDARFYRSEIPGRSGVMLEDGVHMVALARHLMKENPAKISAHICIQQKQRNVEQGVIESQVEDSGVVVLEFKSALATLEASWTVEPGMMCFEIAGTKGTVMNINCGWAGVKIHGVAVKEGSKERQPIPIPSFSERFPGPESYLNEDQLFTQAILRGGSSPYSGEQAMRDMEILALAYEASEKNSQMVLTL